MRGAFAANDISHSEGYSKVATRRTQNYRIVLLHIWSELVDLSLSCDHLESIPQWTYNSEEYYMQMKKFIFLTSLGEVNIMEIKVMSGHVGPQFWVMVIERFVVSAYYYERYSTGFK